MEECQVDIAGIVWAEPGLEGGSFAYLRGPSVKGSGNDGIRGDELMTYWLFVYGTDSRRLRGCQPGRRCTPRVLVMTICS